MENIDNACNICLKRFPSKSKLDRHANKKTPCISQKIDNVNIKSVQLNYEYYCDICKKGFNYKHGLVRHIKEERCKLKDCKLIIDNFIKEKDILSKINQQLKERNKELEELVLSLKSQKSKSSKNNTKLSGFIKKQVAANQQWKCNMCKTILPAAYETDHIIRKEDGGSDELDNLQALCNNCHGEKTWKENCGMRLIKKTTVKNL